MFSSKRKLKDPFVITEVTKKAALGTLKAAKRRSGWPESIGLQGGAPEAKITKSEPVPSKRSIIGRFVGNESELLISFYDSELTIVIRSDHSVCKVNRARVVQVNGTVSKGEAREISDYGEQEVFKQLWLRGGIGENEIEIANYCIENPHLPPNHSSKLIGVTLFNFLNDNGVEKVKVSLCEF